VHSVFQKFSRFLRSLWSGLPLTLQGIGIGIALLLGSVILALIGQSEPGIAILIGFVFTGGATALLLLYLSRLHELELQAQKVSKGVYEKPISIHGGTLGKVSDSINSISEGITLAIEERMKSERLKTDLFTNVSHDIRTPLTSLITYMDLMKREGLDSEKAPEYLEILTQKADRLKILTDDLFEAAKASSGNIDAHLERLDLSALVQQVIGELDERIHSSGLEFRVRAPEHMWINADGKLILRIMENLLSNVFKYSLAHSRVYIEITSEKTDICLSIKNISARELNVDPLELTERFKRGDDARTSEGSGLGLSIVESFVRAQNGRFVLTVDGDLFKATVYLPAPKEESPVRFY
jgi:signal transduction histidine kinase